MPRGVRAPHPLVVNVSARHCHLTPQAVETLFGSKVASVRTSIAHGKFKRQGRFAGQRPDWKRAWVRLKPGEKMPEFMEGT